MSNLAGLHDLEATAIAAPDTWILDTIAISESPIPKSYPANLNVIVRVNWGYGSAGTLPLPSVYDAFAELVAAYVNGCSGCHRWIIGNEPNLSREWPDNTPIYPWHYAACYKLCWQAIHALPGHSHDEVMIAASGPWNNELKYDGNANGDWVQYFADTIDLIGDACDGYSIHSYTHGYDVNLVTSSARMNWPFHNRYYEFYTYRDYCEAIPPELRYLPVYLTEANGNGPWQAVGLMPAMLQEIDSWNHSKLPKILSVIFYRYPKYDQFYIEGRGDVIAEFRAAVERGYQSPIMEPSLPPQPPLPTPEPPTQLPTPAPEPARDIDPRLIARGVHFEYAKVPAGTGYWRIIKAKWLEDAATQVGPDHHIVGRLLQEDVESAGVPLRVDWPSDHTTVISKPDDPNALFNYDYAMGPSLNEYSIRVDDGSPTDKASGIGMGKGGNPREHTSTWITFEWTISEGVTAPDLPPPLQPPATVRGLLWPVVGPVTQAFGEGDAQFGQKAHNGIDIAVPIGTPVLAIADGEVMFVGEDVAYGLYCRVYHPSIHSHSFLAHLSVVNVYDGDHVGQGDTLGLSGNSGNSTGPHLHFELRAGNRDAYYQGVTVGYTQGRYNPVDAYVVTGSSLTPGAEK